MEPAGLDIDGRTYQPAGHIRIWLFRFHPFLSQEAVWNDNIFQTHPDEQEEDFVFDTVFGGRSDWRLGRHETLIGYQAKLRTYIRHADENTLEHRFNVLSLWNFDWFFLDLGERFSQRKDPVPDDIDLITERRENDAWIRFGMYGYRLGFELEYRMRWFDYRDATFDNLDHDEHHATVGAFYLLREDSQIAQKVYAFLEFSYGAFRFHEHIFSDSDNYSGFLGVKGTLFDRFAILLKVGYSVLNPLENGTIDDDERYRGPRYEASIDYLMNEWQKIRLCAYRRLQVSASSNYRVFDRLEGAYEHAFYDAVYVRPLLFIDHTDPSRGRSMTRMGTRCTTEYFFQEWMSFGIYWEFAMRTARRIPGETSLFYRNHIIGIWLTLYL
jgi:hypothetical protein